MTLFGVTAGFPDKYYEVRVRALVCRPYCFVHNSVACDSRLRQRKNSPRLEISATEAA